MIENNLIGKKINMLLILKTEVRKRKRYCYCRCECGNEKWIRFDSIQSNSQKSCGCLRKKTQFKQKDLLGKKFNNLTVIKNTNKKDKEKNYILECKCDCGNIKLVATHDLISGNTKSCGCLYKISRKENSKKAIKANIEKNVVDGTNIALISREKPMKHNTSGFTGVLWDKNRKRWRAEIIFKGKRHYLGRYENKEDAIKARKEGERILHKKFLENINNKNL